MSQKIKALIVDDEPDILDLIAITLERMDIQTALASNLECAKKKLREEEYHFCLTDLKLPDGNGLDLVKVIQKQYPTLPVAVITAFGNMDIAVSALKAGAFDFISKPLNLQHFREMVKSAIKLKDNPKETNKKSVSDPIIGDSDLIKELKVKVEKVSRSQAPVFIHGESGTGKELVARMIHLRSPRQQSPFIAVNCGAIPSELMESEFFGHKKGSFTGASHDKVGLFQAAQGGTLFLDEVADLPKPMQVKLLRAIQERCIRPVGVNQEINFDCRILSATHKDLAQEVSENQFRQDLFYRINVINIEVPPLRARREDILPIATLVLDKLSREWQTTAAVLSDAAKEAIFNYDYPGNVRELENTLEKAVALSDGEVITPEHLSLPTPSAGFNETHVFLDKPQSSVEIQGAKPNRKEGQCLQDFLFEVEKQAIMDALETTRWNKTAAAKVLGMTFRSLRYRLKKLGIDHSE